MPHRKGDAMKLDSLPDTTEEGARGGGGKLLCAALLVLGIVAAIAMYGGA